MSETIQDQPPPVPNAARPAWEMVIEEMKARDHVGRERYGTPLQPLNGRDQLVDAYQEGLDLVVYLRTAIAERGMMIDALREIVVADTHVANALAAGKKAAAGRLGLAIDAARGLLEKLGGTR